MFNLRNVFCRNKSGQKGQGALEYLLIIAGAILIAAIVISVALSSTDSGKQTAEGGISDFNSAVSDRMDDALAGIGGTGGSGDGDTPECTIDNDCDAGKVCNDGVCEDEPIVNLCEGVTCSYGGTCSNGNCSCTGNVEPDCSGCKTGYTGTTCAECATGYYKNDVGSCVEFKYTLDKAYILPAQQGGLPIYTYLGYTAVSQKSIVETYYMTTGSKPVAKFASEEITNRNFWHDDSCSTLSNKISCKEDTVSGSLKLGDFVYNITTSDIEPFVLGKSLGKKTWVAPNSLNARATYTHDCSTPKSCITDVTINYVFSDGKIAKDKIKLTYSVPTNAPLCAVSSGYSPKNKVVEYTPDTYIFKNRTLDPNAGVQKFSITCNYEAPHTLEFVVREGSISTVYSLKFYSGNDTAMWYTGSTLRLTYPVGIYPQ